MRNLTIIIFGTSLLLSFSIYATESFSFVGKIKCELSATFIVFDFDKKIMYFPGKVGISTNNPIYELDVFGDINFTGNLRLNGKEIITELKEEILHLKEQINNILIKLDNLQI